MVKNPEKTNTALPTDSAVRKEIPLARGVLDYFPAALAAVARLSKDGNDKHNPGEDLHWARGKSMDHADCIMRHLAERGTIDTDGHSHSVKVAWRALALLQEEEEARGAPMARGARLAAEQPELKPQPTVPSIFDAAAMQGLKAYQPGAVIRVGNPKKWHEGVVVEGVVTY